MSEYNKLTPPEKRALRKYILNIFKRHNIKKLNNKTVPANKIEILIAEFEIKFKENPIISFRNKLKTKVSNKKGYVYIIGNLDENICKIGFSENPNRRLPEIQTGCPHQLKIILLFEAEKYTETLLHHKYSKYRMVGEWFKIEGKLKDSIEKHIELQLIYS